MFTTFEELLRNSKKKTVATFGGERSAKEWTRTLNKEFDKLGQELNRDIVNELKNGEFSPEMRKELNKQRISALNLKLIQGGKV